MTEQQSDAPPRVTRRRSASLTEYVALLVIQLAAVTVIMFAVGAWINNKWSVLNSALP
jgi:hypothetical protein